MKPVDALLLALVLVVWALNFVFAKAGMSQIPAFLLVTLRFAFVAFLLFPFLRRPQVPLWRLAVVASLVGVVHFGLLFKGLQGVDAGPASVASQTFVVWGALLAWAIYGERLRLVQWGGMGVAFAGVYLMGSEPRMAPNLVNFLMVVGAALALAYATIRVKQLGNVHPMALNAWIAVLAAPPMLAASLLFESDHLGILARADWHGWGAALFMAVGGTIVGHGLWYYLVRRYPVNVTVPPNLLSPVLSVVFAVWLLGEPFGLDMMIGAALTMSGVAIIQFFQLRPAAT